MTRKIIYNLILSVSLIWTALFLFKIKEMAFGSIIAISALLTLFTFIQLIYFSFAKNTKRGRFKRLVSKIEWSLWGLGPDQNVLVFAKRLQKMIEERKEDIDEDYKNQP